MSESDPLDTLAAEYVLGTLRGAACARFEERLRNEPDVARRVREWEVRLSPLADDFAPAQTPDDTWEAIERRLFSVAAAPSRGVALWRRLALGAASLAIALLAVSVWLFAADERPQCYAVLVDAQNRPVLVVFDRSNMRELVTVPVGTRLDAREGSAQLWIVTAGKTMPVGVIGTDHETRLVLGKPLAMAVMAADARLLVTREPAGGSPTGQPGATRVAEGTVAFLGAQGPARAL